MKKIAIIGHFAFGKEFADGQTVKTQIIADELNHRFTANEIEKYDTHNIKKRLAVLPIQLLILLSKCKNVIILPAQNGLIVIATLLAVLNLFFKRELHYIVIGGWLPEFLEKHSFLIQVLKNFSCIYVETEGMKSKLEKKELKNIKTLKNCKKLKVVDESELIYYEKPPYRICTFSRVMKEKGIDDAINVVKRINDESGETLYSLDIYGPIDPKQEEWFKEVENSFPEYINYNGVVPYDRTSEVLKSYFLLLFPTRFYTEGHPGTIIDAYAAGLPVVAAEWENYEDIIDDNTGVGYQFMNENDLYDKLNSIIKDNSLINSMKPECLRKANQFDPSIAVEPLMASLE